MSTTTVLAPPAPRRLRASIPLWTGGIMLGLIAATALLSVFWTPYDPADTGGGRLAPPSLDHWAGTDRLGRDVLTQLMIGARLAMQVGLGSVLIAGVLGTALGVLAASARRWIDDALTSLLDVAIAFPTILLAMLIVAWRGASLSSAILAIGLAGAAVLARLARVVTERILTQDYIIAARTSGTRGAGILFGHILPNLWPSLLVPLALQFGGAVLAEASLSYLGLGSPPPNASWGRLLQEAQGTVTVAPLSAILPGVLLVITVIGVNLLADGLREKFDPTQGGRRS